MHAESRKDRAQQRFMFCILSINKNYCLVTLTSNLLHLKLSVDYVFQILSVPIIWDIKIENNCNKLVYDAEANYINIKIFLFDKVLLFWNCIPFQQQF